MCVFPPHFESYIERSQQWRGRKTQLLLSHIKPQKEVSSSIVSRWLKDTIALAGINTDVFKWHSSKSAASAGAGLAGASIYDILTMGSWSNESSWPKFYDKMVGYFSRRIFPEQIGSKKMIRL